MEKDNNSLYNDLRLRFPQMEYRHYHWHEDDEGLHIAFEFAIGEHLFRPTALVERRPFLHFDLGHEVLDRLVFNIGMIEAVSYWKCACPPRLNIACGTLDDAQIAFWRKLYWHGLGEFFYTNHISAQYDSFIDIAGTRPAPVLHPSCTCPAPNWHQTDAYLVPIGGGKDSVVTLRMLRDAGKTIRPLIMNPRGATTECASTAGYPIGEVLVVRRTIDPNLLQLNAQGYLNGHTPFSAMLAFYTLLASACSGIANIALSNENSANEATVVGTEVNHQYSKSLEFENDFRQYTRATFPEHYNYFSFLRPLTELQIAMLFSRYTEFHDVFRSCNVGSKQDIWCCHCAKCLFAYIILSPFLPPERLSKIFGSDLLDDTTLSHEFDQLTGQAATKPFECVGTVSEVNIALSMALKKWYPTRRPQLLAHYHPTEARLPLTHLAPDNNLSAEEQNIIAQCIAKSN